ncbi:MAG: apolipoprotein N-acyltransferase [Novosphingobium sp.]
MLRQAQHERFGDLVHRFELLTERLFARSRWLALALGALAACAFQPLGLWPLGLLGIAGLVALLADAKTPARAFVFGWLFGLGQFAVGMNWLATAFSFQAAMPVWLGGLAVVGLAGVLAVFPGLAALGGWLLGKGNRSAVILAFAACWIGAEWLRGWVLTGLPWNPLGAITLKSYANPGLAYFGQWLGTYGLSGLVVALAGAWCLAIQRRRADWRSVGLSLAPAALFLIPTPVDHREGAVAYTLVQANVPQEELHDPARFEGTFQRAVRLGKPLVPGQARLVFWSESGLPDYLQRGYPAAWYRATTFAADPDQARRRIGRMIGAGSVLLTGNDRLEMHGGKVVGARAGITAIDSRGEIRGTYDKSHLVPFGEYVPLKWLLDPLGLSRLVPGDYEFWPGPGPRTLDVGPLGKVGLQLCYEIIFPGAITQQGKRPDFVFNPSNEGWYGDWATPQFLAQARLRAIEEGLPVIRATTTGISAVIDASGAVRDSIPLRVAARRDGLIPPAKPPTLFSRLGNGLSLGWAIALLALSLVARRRR